MHPLLRFKQDDGTAFPEWHETTLGALCSQPICYGMKAAATEFDGTNRYLRISDIDNQLPATLRPNTKASPAGNLNPKYLVGEGDLLLERTGSNTGKSYLYQREDGKLYFASNLVRAHFKEDHCAAFFYAHTWSHRYWQWVKNTSLRSAQLGINARQFAAYKLKVPSLKEQQKIAALFTAIDEIIKKQSAKAHAHEKYLETTLHHLLSPKQKDGTKFSPWEMRSLGELGSFTTGVRFSQEYQGHKALPIAAYKISDLETTGNERELKVAANTVSLAIAHKMKATIVERPSIVFVRMGGSLYAERKRIARGPFVLSSNLMAFTPHHTEQTEFLYWLLRTISLSSRAQPGPLPIYSAEDLSQLKATIPTTAEQEQSTTALNTMEEILANERAELAMWYELKRGLLQHMFP